jgi:chitin disaccharide deacetylase
MKWLIVNGDDFGVSRGVNGGIIAAHRRGILTSTSLIVNAPWSAEAAWLSRAVPALSVGLHVHIVSGGKEGATGPIDDDSYLAELCRQFFRFQELVGRLPTHLDSHHNVHRSPRLLPHFLELARQHGLPLREHSPARYFSKFYGQWGGDTHLEQIGVESLVRILETEVQEGVTELSCHPGYVDPDFPSSYSAERETELRTLCDPIVRQALAAQQIQLVSFRDLGALPAESPR